MSLKAEPGWGSPGMAHSLNQPRKGESLCPEWICTRLINELSTHLYKE